VLENHYLHNDMETITKYKAVDGVEFYTHKECEDYELLIEEVDNIMSVLPSPIETCDFFNGSGYIQHDKDTFESVRLKFLQLCQKHIDHNWLQQTIEGNCHPSWVGRLLDDYNIKPLYKSWNRLSRIDKLYREWGQQYFVEHPNKAKQIQLNQ